MIDRTLSSFLCTALVFMFFAPLASGDIEDRFIHPDYSKKISMDFKEASLVDVLKIFSKQSGMNFISAQDVSNKKITLFLDNIPVEEALEKILDANGLTYEMAPDSDVFIVQTKLKDQMITRVYPLKHATVSSSSLNSSPSSAGSAKSSAKGTSIGANTSSSKAGTGTKGGGLSQALKTVMSKGGRLEEDSRTNSLIITDLPDQFPIIEETLAKLDVPVVQILIEVEMLDVSKSASDKMGIKYGNAAGDPFVRVTGAQRASFIPFDEHLIKNKVSNWDELNLWTIPENGYDFSGMTAALDFLKSQTDTRSLARPRLLTLNNQLAHIEITTDEAIGIKSETDNTNSGGSNTTVEAERAITGVSLDVTPQANVETGEITMVVHPKVTDASQKVDFGSTTFFNPEQRESQSILKVRNGETVIIGGLLRKKDQKTSTKLPILSKIPLVGVMFRHKDKKAEERELVIFITPHILNDQIKTRVYNETTKHLDRELDQDARALQIQQHLDSYGE